MRPGITREQAQAALQPAYQSILEHEVGQKDFARASDDQKRRYQESRVEVLPAAQGHSSLRSSVDKPLWVLLAIVGGVLLIACANIANLLLARATRRRSEFALRMALGAGRWRIVRQLLVESIVVALLGVAVGLLLASWTTSSLVQFLPATEQKLQISTAPDLRILLFTFGIAALAAIMAGLVPALQSSGFRLSAALRSEGRTSTGGTRMRKLLVATQISVSLILLIGASLFVRSFQNLHDLDPGIDTAEVIVFSVDPPLNGYTPERTRQFNTRLQRQLESIPGVDSAALGLIRPLQGDTWGNGITVDGREPRTGEQMSASFNAVSPGYFRTLGMKMIQGRDFLDSDGDVTRRVAVVNQEFADYYFGDRSALGRRLGMGTNPGAKTDIEIVGVVSNTKYDDMRGAIRRQVFLPHRQLPWNAGMNGYLRTSLPPEQVQRNVRLGVAELDASLPVYGMRTMEKQRAQSLRTESLLALLATVFGGLATLLAGIGLYGVLAWTVLQRTREFGVRMALGAQSGDVTWLVMKDVCGLLAVSIGIALPVSWALSRLLESQLYAIAPTDPGAIGTSTLGLAGVAVLAALAPALRATRIQPTTALRHE